MILGSGRSPGEGNGNPLQYSFLGNSMDRETWQATAHGVAKSDTTKRLTFSLSLDFRLLEINFPAVGWLALFIGFSLDAGVYNLMLIFFTLAPARDPTQVRVAGLMPPEPWAGWAPVWSLIPVDGAGRGAGLPHGLGTPLGAQLFRATCLVLCGCSHLLP